MTEARSTSSAAQPKDWPEYEIRRRWWLPFAVEVWRYAGDGVHWEHGRFGWYVRIGVFFRRSTAERFLAWRKAHPDA